MFEFFKSRWKSWPPKPGAVKDFEVIEIQEKDGKIYNAYRHDGVGSNWGGGWMGCPIHHSIAPVKWRRK